MLEGLGLGRLVAGPQGVPQEGSLGLLATPASPEPAPGVQSPPWGYDDEEVAVVTWQGDDAVEPGARPAAAFAAAAAAAAAPTAEEAASLAAALCAVSCEDDAGAMDEGEDGAALEGPAPEGAHVARSQGQCASLAPIDHMFSVARGNSG